MADAPGTWRERPQTKVMIAERETSVTAGPLRAENRESGGSRVREDRGSGSLVGLLIQQKLRHLGERVEGVEDVVAGVEA